MQTCFSEFQSKSILKCPKFETSMSGACFPDWGPGPQLSLASTAALLDSRNSAAATWPFSAANCSGVRPQAAFLPENGGRCGLPADHGAEADAPRGRRKLWAAPLYARSTDKRTMNVFGLNSFKLCKAKYIHTQSQTHQTSLVAFCFQQITFNEMLSIVYGLILCFQKLKRLLKTRSSSKSNSW